MSLEQSLCALFNTFDGSKKDFVEIETYFDAAYHESFVHEMDGNPVNKEKLREMLANMLAIGTKAELLSFRSVAHNDVEFQFRLSNEKMDSVIHNFATLKDNKLLRVYAIHDTLESLQKARLVSIFYTMEQNFRSYINVFDGKIKPFSEMEILFNDLFHKDFIHTMDGNAFNKKEWRDGVETFLFLGTKADLKLFNQLDDTHFEVKVHFLSDSVDFLAHSIGTVKDKKLIKLEPCKGTEPPFMEIRRILDLSLVKKDMTSSA